MIGFDPITEDGQNKSNSSSLIVPAVFESYGSKLLGSMLLASGEGLHPVIILLHGFPGNELNYDIAHVFRRQGFNVLIFHYRGTWGSEGEYLWSNSVVDVVSAINFLKTKEAHEKFFIDGSKIILIGHSMGGFNALYNAACFDEIKFAAFLAGMNPGILGELIEKNKVIYDYAVESMQPAMEFVRCSSPEILFNEMINNKKKWNLLNHLDKLSQKHLLIVSARNDPVVPLEIHHKPLVGALKMIGAKNVKEFVLEATHSFTNKRIALAKIISDWLAEIKF